MCSEGRFDVAVMPFTVTHVVAAAPLAAIWRGRTVLSGLIVGSMVPDVTLVVPVLPGAGRDVGHTLLGTLIFCLPVGLALLVLWHTCLKRPVIEMLPAGQRLRLYRHADERWVWSQLSILSACAAIAVGVLTHIVWDSFTHAGSPMVQWFPQLSTTIAVAGHAIPVYKILQYGSSAVGLPLLAVMYLLWVRRHVASSPGSGSTLAARQRNRLRAAIVVLTVSLAVAFFFSGLYQGELSTSYAAFGRAVRATMLGFSLALVACSLAYWARRGGMGQRC